MPYADNNDTASEQPAHLHESHPAITKRLKRAAGHLGHVIEMIEGHKGCTDIAQQLHAVEKAIANAKRALIQDHIDHCLEGSLNEDEGTRAKVLEDFKIIAKYL
ncbi:metal-sensing transcriptional repressor [uncultured Cohaesibacter sp.]|uniref:metal-sensing transcriptional repressor n=1 Tax=uncultured Cohaesibacter sp. TaxID=1002546 RepID=UPI0029C73D2D|nr:metal-sensing transcriptional repressor [uncultured Cohaesibacter sp.]